MGQVDVTFLQILGKFLAFQKLNFYMEFNGSVLKRSRRAEIML